MPGADRRDIEEVQREARERNRLDRGERIRELVRSDLRALNDAAKDCGLNLHQVKLSIDSGDPSASLVLAICEHYNVSEQFIFHGSDLFDTDAMGMALDVVMSAVLSRAIPTKRGLSLNPASDPEMLSRTGSMYTEALARHVAGHAQVHYERFVHSIRERNKTDAAASATETSEYSDPWSDEDAAHKPDNVSHLPRRKPGGSSSTKPL